MNSRVLVSFLSLFPVVSGAADLPFALELDAGVGAAIQVRDQSGLDEPRGNRLLVARREEAAEVPVGVLGATVRHRVGERLDAFARIDWRAAQDVDLEYAYDFANGDHAAGTTTLDAARLTHAMAGLRWTVPATGCWSTEISGDLRHLDSDIYSVIPGFMGLPSTVVKDESSAAGIGLGVAVSCRVDDAWSIVVGGEAARLEDDSQYAASLSLRWRIR